MSCVTASLMNLRNLPGHAGVLRIRSYKSHHVGVWFFLNKVLGKLFFLLVVPICGQMRAADYQYWEVSSENNLDGNLNKVCMQKAFKALLFKWSLPGDGFYVSYLEMRFVWMLLACLHFIRMLLHFLNKVQACIRMFVADIVANMNDKLLLWEQAKTVFVTFKNE